MTTHPLLLRAKPHKLPIDPLSGGLAASTRRQTWGTYQHAVEAVHSFSITGVGFVFSDDDPYSGVDLDNCRNPETGSIEPWAAEIVRHLNSYTEVSPSGKGVKIFVQAKLPPKSRSRMNTRPVKSRSTAVDVTSPLRVNR